MTKCAARDGARSSSPQLRQQVAVVLGILFRGERLGAVTMIGGARVLIGVFLYQQAEQRKL